MDAAAIARPYAAAAFSQAADTGSIDKWLGALRAMAAVAAALKELAAGGALIGAAQGAEAALAAANKSGKTDAAMQRFVALLAENDRIFALPAIFSRFDQLRREAADIVAVRVEHAMPIDKKEFDRHLQQRLGKTVESEYAENPDLLGGARVFVGDNVIDASIRGRLDKLSVSLTGSAAGAASGAAGKNS